VPVARGGASLLRLFPVQDNAISCHFVPDRARSCRLVAGTCQFGVVRALIVTFAPPAGPTAVPRRPRPRAPQRLHDSVAAPRETSCAPTPRCYRDAACVANASRGGCRPVRDHVRSACAAASQRQRGVQSSCDVPATARLCRGFPTTARKSRRTTAVPRRSRDCATMPVAFPTTAPKPRRITAVPATARPNVIPIRRGFAEDRAKSGQAAVPGNATSCQVVPSRGQITPGGENCEFRVDSKP